LGYFASKISPNPRYRAKKYTSVDDVSIPTILSRYVSIGENKNNPAMIKGVEGRKNIPSMDNIPK
jgi:hypothetical protein